MIFDDDATIERLAVRLIDHSLPHGEWTHAAHFAATLWLLRHRPALTGAAAMRDLISRYNAAVGTVNDDNGGYHHTIARASVGAAARHLRGHPADTPLHVMLAVLMASPQGRSDWLLGYWRRETLFGVAARRDRVAPDLTPLPF